MLFTLTMVCPISDIGSPGSSDEPLIRLLERHVDDGSMEGARERVGVVWMLTTPGAIATAELWTTLRQCY